MKNNEEKQGIALISVVFVIMILLLLSGLTTYFSYDIITKTKEIAFSKDMETIYDACDEYYAVNGSIPSLEGGITLTTEQYKQNINEIKGKKNSDLLESTIVKNGDEEAMFYEVDISKIGVEDMKYGIKKDENDIFLISNESHVVYYYPGYEIGENIFFDSINILDKTN